MAKKEKKSKPAGRKKMPLWLIIPAVLILTVLLKGGFILILFGILPTIVAYYADTSHEQHGVATIACCNISGTLPYVMELNNAGNSWSQLSSYLGDPMMWMTMYGMAALGYGLIKICPMVCHYGLRVINTSLAFGVQQKQDALVREWGESIRTNTTEIEEDASSNALVVV
jgi:hypothetical protein